MVGGGDAAETFTVNMRFPCCFNDVLRNDFERGATDVFLFDDKNVGNLRKIRMGHDGSGLGAGWHLQRVVVENLTSGQVVVCDVNRCDWGTRSWAIALVLRF